MTGLAGLDADALWTAVGAAAAGTRTGHAGAVAELCGSGGSARLGWVRPAPWPVVREGLSAIRGALDAPEVVLLGTGGWCFAAQALGEATGIRGRLVPLDSLDPDAIRGVTAGAYLAVSGSGTTLETRVLADAVPGRPVWLRDSAGPDGFALSPYGVPDQVAMLGAPLSMAFLAAASIVDSSALDAAYPRFVERYPGIAVRAVRRATGVAVSGPVRVCFVVPPWGGPGLRRWLLQLGRQVLAGKSERFRPAVEVTDAPGGDVVLDFTAVPRGLPGLLDICYAAGVFTACLGLRAGIGVADHANVRAYKDRLTQDGTPVPAIAGEDVPALVATWLSTGSWARRLHVVRYWAGEPGADPLTARVAAAAGLPCETHEGSAWNHHSFQAVYADPDTAVLLLTRPAGPDVVAPDHRPDAVVRAGRTLGRIAWATHRALGERSMLVAVARAPERAAARTEGG